MLRRAEDDLCSLIASYRDNSIAVVRQQVGCGDESLLVVCDLKHHALAGYLTGGSYIQESDNLAGWRVHCEALVRRTVREFLKLSASAFQPVHGTTPNQRIILEALEQIVVPLHGSLVTCPPGESDYNTKWGGRRDLYFHMPKIRVFHRYLWRTFPRGSGEGPRGFATPEFPSSEVAYMAYFLTLPIGARGWNSNRFCVSHF